MEYIIVGKEVESGGQRSKQPPRIRPHWTRHCLKGSGRRLPTAKSKARNPCPESLWLKGTEGRREEPKHPGQH